MTLARAAAGQIVDNAGGDVRGIGEPLELTIKAMAMTAKMKGVQTEVVLSAAIPTRFFGATVADSLRRVAHDASL